MRTTSFRRTVAALLAAALGTGTLVAGSAPSVAAPAVTADTATTAGAAAVDIGAAPPAANTANTANTADTAAEAVAGTLDWGVKASFRSYITGPIAHGSIEVRDPATRNGDGTFRFADATGTADPDAGTADLGFAGEVYFAGHDMGAGPLLELTVTDPRVTVSSATDGVLVADVVSKSLDSGQLVTYDDVELADLDLTDHPLTFDGDTVSAAGVPATLTAAGVPAFANFYTAGTVLDPITFTATLEEAQPVWEPSIEVLAADGVTPAADADLTYGDTVVVKGEGFDPAGNVAPEGNRPPIPAGVPAGTYVVFGKFAEQWQPSAGAPSSARTVGTQKWALAQAALDQVPAQYQSAIRAQWADVQPDGTFTAELTLAKPADRTTGEPIEWPATGNLGVYTYAAGGTVNADQELTVPLTVAEQPDPDPDPIEVTDATFEWGINLVSQYGSPAGGCSFFVAGIADGTEASYKVQDGDVYLLKRLADGRATAVTAENRCLPLVDDKINQRALFTGGTGELDAAGAGSIAWTGAFTIYSYGGMVPWYVKDPVLTVDGEGNGAITAEVGGFASSMEDPTVKEPLDPEQGVTVLELDGVAIEDGVVTGTPVYQGVDYFPLNDPADPASGRRETSAIPDEAKAANPNWGSWPTPIVDFHYRTGLSSYWHTSGLSADPNKPPLPVLLELDGGVPEFVDAHPVTISAQPQWTQAVTGEDTTFTVTAESDDDALTYQWQRRNPGTSDWVAVGGATGVTLTLPGVTPADTGTYVRVVVANSTTSITSSAAGLQVQDAAAPALGSSPADVTTFVGYQAQFAADLAGWPRPTYQWQTSTDGGETWTDHGEAGNASSIELTGLTADQDGLRVRAVGSNGRGADVVTEAAELTVLPAPSEPTLAFPEGAEFDPAAEFLVLTAVGGGYPVPTGTVTLAVVEADVWAARDDTFDRETDTVAWSEIHSSNFTGGFFDAGLYVEPGLIDPEKDYVLVTFSITPGDHSHDAEAAIPFGPGEQPTWEPSIEVFAADGVTPVAEAELTYGDTVVVRGSGFDPEGNVAPEGNRPPIPAGVPAGAYVVFGSFADQWQPSQGAPSSARTVGAQQWALAQAALDQVPAQYQDAIRAQWVEIAADGTFTAEPTLAKPTDRTTGEPVEWPEGTTPGVYTYAAGGTVNADQELYVPLTVADEEPAGPALTLSASTGLDNAGSNVVEATGTGFDPQTAIEVVQAVRVEGADPSSWPTAIGSARVMTTADGSFLVPAALNTVTSRFVPDGSGDVYDCKVVECVVLAYDFGDPADRTQDAWAPIAFDDAERPAPSVTLDSTDFPAEGGSTTVHGGGFIAGDHLLVVQTSALGAASDPRELPRNPAGTSQLVPGEGDGAWALRLDGLAPTFTSTTGTVVDCREVECAVAVFPSRRADLGQSVFVPITFADEEPPTGTGTLDWGLKASFRNYITGPIAHGSIEVREPATRNEDGTFRFAGGTGTGSAEAAELAFAGEVYFAGHDMGAGPLLELTVTDPRVTVSSATDGVLVADVVSKSLDSGELVTYDDVEFATLDFTGHAVTVTDGVASASGVPAALTEAGAAAFAGFYTAGTELDPVTFSVTLEDEPPAPTPTIVVSEVEDLDPYADQITVTGSGFEPADLAGGLRVGVGVVTTDGSVPALDPVETVTFEPVSGLLSFARAALGTFEITLTTGEVEPGTTLAVHTSPVDASADLAYTTQTPIAFADVRTPQLTVTPTEELAVGTEVRIEGTGFAPNRRISLAITANAEQDLEYGWPTGWLQHEVVQADASGALSRMLMLAGTVTGSGVDCVETACFVASFSSAQASDATPVDYRADRSQDVLVAVAFATDPGPEPEPPAVTVDPDPAVQGEPVTFTGTGFEPGATVTAVVDRDAPPPGGTGTLDWGVKESFRNYINGPIAHGAIEVRDPATENADGTFRFAEGTGDATALAFGGEVYFSGHDMGAGPLLELTITDPRVTVTSADAGVLVADVVSKSLSSGELVTYDGVELAALDFTDHPVTETDGVVAASDVPAALTEDGVAAFADFYPAGTELDPVTFAVPVDGSASADGARATAASVEAGTGTVGDDGAVEIGWTVPADLATGGHTVDLVVADESLASTAFTVEEADGEPEPEPEPDPAVSVDPETVAQGGTVTFTGTDFGAEESVEATILIDAATEELTFDNDHGQAVTVRSADGNPLVLRDGNLLVVDGGELDVTLTGLEPTSEENTPEAPAGFYLLTAVDNGPGEVATPAIGGADTTGESGTSRWITNFPYPGSEDIVVPIADGVAETSLTLVEADEFADCEVDCVLYLRTDHRSAANREFDLRVPLEFVSADELAEAAQAEPVTVSGTTNADGEVALEWTVPADSPVGPATVTLTGADSALTASAPFTVTAASPGGDDNGSDEGGSDEGGSEDGSDDGTDGGSEPGADDGDGDGDLPDTGTDPSVILIVGLALLAGGVAVALYDRRRRA
ncbi:HtaA domain-containing protein [Jiangella alkaliphila]|uniref:LPXTG-motif cell wall anchor domain-containing protein n=1 Tax=Jiangella alkaliphila TaxID=419479 RepID=A0A1H2GQ66_9ACTN|nr:HtaA domain-containing protein [Jiangella alkaliphila]SDU21518.1 LPXTG-motif cell wall anchor domain-containing protein [Jiangella alkaliphila]